MNHSEIGKKGSEASHKALETHRNQQQQAAILRYEENPKLCPTCGEFIPYEKRYNKFCNQSCAASYNNQGVLRVKKNPPKTCVHCGKSVEKRQNKYCDACIEAGFHVRRITDLADATIDRTRKRILIEQRGHQCQTCNRSNWLGQPIPLELHHNDGNADNSDESNLELICPNCHALTDNYKGANMGVDSSRQKKRRRRYKQGKTY